MIIVNQTFGTKYVNRFLLNLVLSLCKEQKQVHSDNDASEVDFGTFWDNSEYFLMSWENLDSFPMYFRPFLSLIGPLKKKHGRTDPLIEMRGRI